MCTQYTRDANGNTHSHPASVAGGSTIVILRWRLWILGTSGLSYKSLLLVIRYNYISLRRQIVSRDAFLKFHFALNSLFLDLYVD